MFTTLITTDELAQSLGSADFVVLDCRFDLADPERGRALYVENHIATAIFADLNRDLCAPILPGVTGRHPLPDVNTFAERLSAWGIDEHTQVVAYDENFAYAPHLWWMLRWVGHDKVAVLDGGLKAWRRENRPLSKAVPQSTRRTFVPHERSAMIAERGDVAAIVAGEATGALQDARAADRFRGENEIIDPVAGHIPGATNVPWMANVGSDGYLLPVPSLLTRFAPLISGTDGSEVVAYCGSGVTAAVNLLSMEVAGIHGARLYPGSWSDWIIDPDNPIA